MVALAASFIVTNRLSPTLSMHAFLYERQHASGRFLPSIFLQHNQSAILCPCATG
jgi:hypothetical protein